MVRIFSHGAIELQSDRDSIFKLNGCYVKYYIGSMEELKVSQNDSLAKVFVAK